MSATADTDLSVAVEAINLARDRAETDRERDLVSHAADMVFWARKVGHSRRLIVALVAIAEIAERPAPSAQDTPLGRGRVVEHPWPLRRPHGLEEGSMRTNTAIADAVDWALNEHGRQIEPADLMRELTAELGRAPRADEWQRACSLVAADVDCWVDDAENDVQVSEIQAFAREVRGWAMPVVETAESEAA